MENVWKILSLSGISETASSTTSYKSVWKKQIGKCFRRQNDPFYYDINPVLDFLDKLFQAGYKFRATGSHNQ